MPESPIRTIQCPYCKQKFGIQPDQAVEFCFLCGGRLNLQPKIKKPNVLAVLFGALQQRVKANLQDSQQVDEPAKSVVSIPLESTPPFMEENPISEVDDFHFDPIAQIWVAPNEPEELVFLDEEIDYFDPVASLRSEMPYVEEPPAEVKKEPLDLIDQLRYADSSGPVFMEEPEQPAEPILSGRTKYIVIGGIAVVVVVILIILMGKIMG